MRFLLGRNIYFKLKHESVKNNKSKVKIKIISKSDWTQFHASTDYLCSSKHVRKQTKSENISAILDLNFRLDQRNKRLKKQHCFKREGHCCHGGLLSPKKRILYEKCIVLPVVDSKVNPNFMVLNVPRRGHTFQKCLNVSKMANHPSEISSLR